MIARRRPGRTARVRSLVLLAAVIPAGGVTPVSARDQAAGSRRSAVPTIGVATQDEDGTLVLTLRAEASGGAIGDAQFRYPRSDPDHAMIARHVGPVPPGGSVPIRPFGAR